MGYPLKKTGAERFTWQDYLTWPEEERWEVIDGEAYNMTPSPTFNHQRLVGNFYSAMKDKLKGTPCVVVISPIDVKFDEYNFVQPDVLVVCDRNKIKDRVYGAPDLVIEVLSPYTSLKDRRKKKELYERFGVREFIIVHPEENYIERFLFRDNRYGEPDVFGAEEVFKSGIFDVEIPLWEVFETELPESEDRA